MGAGLRSCSSFLLKLVGLSTSLGGVALGGVALMVNVDASISVFMGVIAMGGLLVAVVGGVFMAIGALLGRGQATAAKPASLSPEQQQLRDSQEFLATQLVEERDQGPGS